MACADDWTGSDARILFVCPDIEANHYYANVHREFVKTLGMLPHAIAGMQAVRSSDPTILGYVPRDVHEQNMRSFLAAVFAVLVFTATIFTLVAAPGFLSDQASIVPNHATRPL